MSRRGATLLEVMVAVSILATVGTALAQLLGAAAHAESAAERRERALADQDRLLAAYTLLSRVDLDRRLGRRPVGEHLVDVQRPEPALYRIAVGQPDGQADLVTVVYRPEYRAEADSS